MALSVVQAAKHPAAPKQTQTSVTIGAVPDAGNLQKATASSAGGGSHAPCSPTDPSNVTLSAGAGQIVMCGVTGSYLVDGSLSNTYVYKGIEYARAGRWQYSTPIAPLAGLADAFGPICPQPDPQHKLPAMDENCLYLNVWVPKGTAPGAGLPVMVYIHGGAFVSGYGSAKLFDGSALAHQNVIFVTLNYRLGALGFLASDSTGTANWPLAAGGNFGLKDQSVALQWVQSHIASFGGNPGRVTIFGESAGAMSVGLHLFDTQSYDKSQNNGTLPFSAAIMESNPMANLYLTPDKADQIGDMFARSLCKNSSANTGSGVAPACAAGWWQNVPTSAVLTAQNNFLTQQVDPNCVISCEWIITQYVKEGWLGLRSLSFQPVVDGTVVAGEPFQGYASAATPLPAVIGVNKDEGVLFAAVLAGSYAKIPLWPPVAHEPTAKVYDEFVNGAFQASNHTNFAAWLAGDAAAKGLYDYNTLPGMKYYNGHGAALANVINDSSFDCGNVAAADAAVGVSNAPALYAYVFTEPPVFDMYYATDNGACQMRAGHTCHGNELPYVFNTLMTVLPVGKPLPSGDQALADKMTAAWAAFAQNPANPGSIWTAKYQGAGAPAVVLNQTATPNASLDTHGVCAAVWDKVTPPIYK